MSVQHHRLTLALSPQQPEALHAGAGVAAGRVDAHLGGVTVMGVPLTFIDVCKKKSRDAGYCCVFTACTDTDQFNSLITLVPGGRE